jgi:RNA recognition motif-containing protein
MAGSSANSTTLFLGDLSAYCTDADVLGIFKNFGPIEYIQIKHPPLKPHLCYGFVKFHYRESAEMALNALNGIILLGRPLRLVCWLVSKNHSYFHFYRLGWASSNPTEKNMLALFQEKKKPTAQVHVTFYCPMNAAPVTEAKLREIFDRFGEVLDITINRADFQKDTFTHSGYGFIHYELSPKGINSALLAIDQMRERVVNSIAISCTVSHGLEVYLKSAGTGITQPKLAPTSNAVPLPIPSAASNRPPIMNHSSIPMNYHPQMAPSYAPQQMSQLSPPQPPQMSHFQYNLSNSSASSSSSSLPFLSVEPPSPFPVNSLNSNRGLENISSAITHFTNRYADLSGNFKL